jgi:hypothetical protein
MNLEQEVYKTALLLVEHFSHFEQRRKIDLDYTGRHTRLFQNILHPEWYFVGYGKTKETLTDNEMYPEHVVPCTVLMDECERLIADGMAYEEIAKLLVKHWKIVYITYAQAKSLDTRSGINLKSKMPEGWRFETGDTFARLKLANIIKDEKELLPID